MFLEDILDAKQMKWAEQTLCVEVEFIYTMDPRVPCYSTIIYALPDLKSAKKVREKIERDFGKYGYQILNICMTTWNVKEYLESCFEKCHNEKYIKTTLKFLMEGE